MTDEPRFKQVRVRVHTARWYHPAVWLLTQAARLHLVSHSRAMSVADGWHFHAVRYRTNGGRWRRLRRAA